MDKEVEGIILYETPFQESSKIIQVLTKEYGLIGILCRGVLKPKSKFRCKLRNSYKTIDAIAFGNKVEEFKEDFAKMADELDKASEVSTNADFNEFLKGIYILLEDDVIDFKNDIY